MTDGPKEAREGPVSLGLLLLSAAVLLLEVGQVRIFSYLLWHHVTYLVVTVTLLGFAAGGTWLAVRPGGDPLVRAGRGALGFGLLSLVTFWIMARHRIEVLPDADVRLPALQATLSYIYLVVPFFCGGFGIAAALQGVGAKVSRRYGINMIGSAAGALLALPVLREFGGGGLVLVATSLGLLGAGFLWLGAQRPRAASLGVVLAVLAFAFANHGDRLLPFPVAAGKTLQLELDEGAELLASYWDPICRVDVVGDEAEDMSLRVYQDGDAPTWIPSGEKVDVPSLMSNHMALGYLLKFDPATRTSRDKALVIGVGGGHDIKTALVMGAKHITGAEINRSTAAMMQGRFAEYSGNLYGHEDVDIVVADGRSVVARSDEQYDIIQITGADTYAALASGANLVAESYLYTIDAVDDYLDHLVDDGVLCVLRWRFKPPRESLRLAGMAAEALLLRGSAQPSAHIAVINVDALGDLFDKREENANYAVTLVKKTPFTEKEITDLRRFTTEHHRADAYSVAYLPGDPGNEAEFEEYLTAIDRGLDAKREFEASYAYAIDTVTDDRPFFFQFFRGGDLLGAREEERGEEFFRSVIGLGPAGLQVLWYSLIVSVGLVLLLVVLPLALFRGKGLVVGGAFRMVVFFVAVGLAYLAVEIATMQRLTLYLGHPLKALGFGLTTFLVGSGIGAAVSARVAPGDERRMVTRGALAVVGLLLAHIFLVPALFAGTLHLSDGMRELVAVLAITPLAFFMGVPFPLGLRFARERAEPLLPWAFGVNGGASVIASVMAILLAMERGFAFVLVVCLVLYAVAAFALPKNNTVG